ncbi:MAG: DNA primase [Chloroherpetonaceae bacterium]|nr:DNA primase [Chloroherpetonaceae bacterium]
MLIPQSKIDEIKQASDIVDVISDYVALQPAGKRYKAKSPFKPTERTPSFFVNPELQIFKCFSTGIGGDVFTFVMKLERMTYIEAVKHLAKRARIDLSKFEKSDQAANQENTDHDVLTWAAKCFHRALSEPEGKIALDYFLERGLSKDTISAFGLGYSRDSWDWLIHQAEREKIPFEKLKTLGLVAFSDKAEKYYDVFRARAMFPIFSPAGKVIAFGGRILTKDNEVAKYINSPESKLYEKSKVLYAYNFAKDDIRRKNESILVEGYMDVLAMHQAGFKTAVASSGTSLTAEQSRMLGRLSKNVLFIYDGDSAGIKAMLRGIDILLEEGLTPRVLLLPDGHDPDSFVKAFGAEELNRFAAQNKKSFLDFKLEFYHREGYFETSERSSEAVKEIVQMIFKIPDEITQGFYLKEAAEKTGVLYGALERELSKLKKGKSNRESRFRPNRGPLQPGAEIGTIRRYEKFSPEERAGDAGAELAVKEKLPFSEITAAEKSLLKSLLESTYHGTAILEFLRFHRDLFPLPHSDVGRAIDFILSRFAQAEAENRIDEFNVVTELNQAEEEALRDYLTGLLVEPPISDRWQTDPPHVYAKRCLNEFWDAGLKLLIIPYDERIHAKKREMEEGVQKGLENSLEQEGQLKELASLIKQRNEAQQKFNGALKSLLI